MSYIEIELTGKAFAEGLEAAWCASHDMRSTETKYDEDVVDFVRGVLDVIDDSELDDMLRIMLETRRNGG